MIFEANIKKKLKSSDKSIKARGEICLTVFIQDMI